MALGYRLADEMAGIVDDDPRVQRQQSWPYSYPPPVPKKPPPPLGDYLADKLEPYVNQPGLGGELARMARFQIAPERTLKPNERLLRGVKEGGDYELQEGERAGDEPGTAFDAQGNKLSFKHPPQLRQFADLIGDMMGPGIPKDPSVIASGIRLSRGKPIRAYHGSPHDFDKFDLSKVGTGEGHQAYGHGLYFAENEGVARGYRDALSPGRGTTSADIAARLLRAFDNDQERALADVRRRINNANIRGVPPDDMRKLMDAKNIINTNPYKATGRMYEVDIHADPNKLVDWDKPLIKQSPDIWEALKLRPIKGRPSDAEPMWNSETLGHYINPDAALNRPSAAAADALREAGVPGIKYLDAGSRAAGEGTRNYVMFDDKLIDVLRKYGVASFAALPPAVQMALSTNQGEAQQ